MSRGTKLFAESLFILQLLYVLPVFELLLALAVRRVIFSTFFS